MTRSINTEKETNLFKYLKAVILQTNVVINKGDDEEGEVAIAYIAKPLQYYSNKFYRVIIDIGTLKSLTAS